MALNMTLDIALKFINPTDYMTKVKSFITSIKTKQDYLKTWAELNVKVPKSKKTPGDKIFHSSIFKADKNKIDLSHFSLILSNNNLSEQERKFYLLQKFMLKMADDDYKQVSDIVTLFNLNIKHIKELLAIKKNGKENKLVFLIPNNLYEMDKSNFWLSLFFVELSKNKLNPNYYINGTECLNGFETNGNSNFKQNFPDAELYNYIVVITDDISYSGSQLSISTFHRGQIHNNVTIFLNLVGYSEGALKRLNKEKDNSGTMCDLVFGKGAKYPLNKLSARFNDSKVKNNVLYKKSQEDFVTTNSQVNIRMLSSLILNDVFYLSIEPSPNKICFISNLFSIYKHYETKTKTQDNNGSIQYLSIKYPDSYSTVENMCKFFRLQNVAILRIDRLINYLDMPEKSNEQKLDYLAKKIIAKDLWEDTGSSVYIKFNLIDAFINNSDGDFRVLPNSFDKKFIDLFTKQDNACHLNTLNNKLIATFNKNPDNVNFNNLVLNKFVNINNKISKFNKKHLLEFVMPKSNYQVKQTSKFTIKNCSNPSYRTEPFDLSSNMYCNKTCSLNFYKKIKWD